MRIRDRLLSYRLRLGRAVKFIRFQKQSIVFALVLIGLVWAGIGYLKLVEEKGAELAALRTSDNLVRAFGNQFSAGLDEADRILVAMRESFVSSPESFEFKPWMPSSNSAESPILALGIIDQSGMLRSTSAIDDFRSRIDLSGTDQFKVHIESQGDDPFISRSTIGRTTGKPSILLTRRISHTDGSFGGVVTASLSLSFFTSLYDTVDLGSDGFINVTGADGVVRITDKAHSERVGLDLSKSSLLSNYHLKPAGYFYTIGRASDDKPRLVTYRPIGKYPLIISIGLSQNEVFGSADLHARVYNYIGFGVSTIILIVSWFQLRNGAVLARMAEELHESSGRLHAAISNMSQGLAMFDAGQRLIIRNRQFCEIYGLDEKQTKRGTTLRTILEYGTASGNGPSANASFIEKQIANVETGKPFEIIRQLHDGRYIAVMSRPTVDGGWVSTHEDVTSRKISEVRIEHMAHHDALTGLGNRIALTEKIEDASARFRRRGEVFTLLMLDLDNFKQVNDTLGHGVGDALLRDVASRMKSCLRETDSLARLGGDEFAIIQAGEASQREAAVSLADRFIGEVAKPFSLAGKELYIGASVGIALAPEHATNTDDLMRMADIALYNAKETGRNCYRVFGAEMTKAMSERNEIERELRHAIENDELILHYQPIIDAKTHRMCGAEALVRWQHPTKGLIAPDQFIPLAEDTGLISPIGEWVLHTACKEATAWPDEMKVAVNLSARQFADGNLADVVMYILAETGLPPERLELEITETALMGSAAEVLPVLRQFKNLGISVALDDFGTGYSSFSQLTMFPFDNIKIDKSFIKGMTTRADCAAIIAATMTLAYGLDKETTAEGVETQEQYKLLRLAGVTSLQGYLFKQPGPASELDFDGVYGKVELENAA